MQFSNLKIYQPDGTFRTGSLAVADDRILAAGETGDAVDMDGLYAIPGLVDLHFHGCMGADFSDASAFIVDPFGEDSNYSFIYESDDPQTQEYYQEYLALVEEALAITDDDEARYETFAKAEAVLLDHGFAIPIHTNDRVYTFGKLNVFEGPYAAFGFSTLRYKGQHVMETSMGMEEFEEAYQTWLTEREEALAAAAE